MIYLSQRDPRWGDVKLGASSIDVHHYGCTTTCISMLSDYFKCLVYPDAIARKIKNYTRDGLIIWGNLEFEKMKFERREYGYVPKNIDAALAHPDTAVILQVNHGKHWVVAIRKSYLGLGSGYIAVDPWTGAKCDVFKVYKNITGAAYFRRK